jgi:hypothetical protein
VTEPDPLAFDPPQEDVATSWPQAERTSFKFAEKYLALARELHQARQGERAAWEERDRKVAGLVRNLIGVLDNCRPALDADAEPSLTRAALASAERSLLHLLEGLDVFRIELKGRTYADVAFDGQPIDDPFEVLEAAGAGRSTAQPVREVVSDLWVRRHHGAVEIVRRGRVTC